MEAIRIQATQSVLTLCSAYVVVCDRVSLQGRLLVDGIAARGSRSELIFLTTDNG